MALLIAILFSFNAALECFVDRRITVGRLKYLLSSFVDTTPEQFRVTNLHYILQ